jgi:hypothetical protein
LTRAYIGYAVPIGVDVIGLEAMIAAYDIDLAGSRVGMQGDELRSRLRCRARERRGWIGAMGVAPGARRARRRGGDLGRSSGRRRMRLKSIDLESAHGQLSCHPHLRIAGLQTPADFDVWLRDSSATFPMPPGHEAEAVEWFACRPCSTSCT